MVGQAKPWHLTAHKIMQGITYVHDKKGPAEALKCFRFFLDNIPAWDNNILQTKSISQFMDALAGQFEILSGVSQAELRPQLPHYSAYDNKARLEFKHTIGNRFSGLNPTIYVNGAKVDNGLNLTLQQWKDLINSLLKWWNKHKKYPFISNYLYIHRPHIISFSFSTISLRTLTISAILSSNRQFRDSKNEQFSEINSIIWLNF